MDMHEKIKYHREKLGLTLEELGKRVGVGKSTVRKWETGMIANMRRDKIEKVAIALNISPAYLMGWEDNPTLPPYDNIRQIQKQTLPVLGSVAAGKPILMEEQREVYVETPIKADFILIVKGDSMTGARINDGDIVFIRQQPIVENGEIAVVAIDDEATLKRFYKYGEELIVLRSENPNYADMEYRPEDGKEIHVLGKAVAFQSDVR